MSLKNISLAKMPLQNKIRTYYDILLCLKEIGLKDFFKLN